MQLAAPYKTKCIATLNIAKSNAIEKILIFLLNIVDYCLPLIIEFRLFFVYYLKQ